VDDDPSQETQIAELRRPEQLRFRLAAKVQQLGQSLT
jgi:hypothetical protein